MRLGREAFPRLFEELSIELRFLRARAQIYVIGGPAMSLAFARDRTTRDVDARVDAGHYRRLQAWRRIARRHRLPDSWLNEQAVNAMPRTPDSMARTLYSTPHLTVTGASPKRLLAMKLRACRHKDKEGIRVLADLLDLQDPDHGRRSHGSLFPDVAMPTRAQRYLEDACARRTDAGREGAAVADRTQDAGIGDDD